MLSTLIPRMHRGPLVRTALVAGLVLPSAAHAGCVWSDLVDEEARVAAVTSSSGRVHFVEDDVLVHGCPNDSAACRERAFVLPGDVVLAGPTQGAYTCAGYAGAKGFATIGWLPSAALTALPQAQQAPQDWAGHWIAPEQDITVTSDAAGLLAVDGEATWGMGDPWRRKNGGVHVGVLSGKVRPANGAIAFSTGANDETLPYEAGDEFDCRVRMVRRGPYLLARDNNNCGGANVTFSGFYVRAK
ncbi:hypothetical protein SAMN05216548_111118 [Faunimonas pinastri]|uniref:Uncharacterized protein n=1 Tax=Faunimonas pinastri TaxID=1855383 RepID=A0A1H9LKK5_9HYPH|nr:hypothetical protein [Faunimonas pinastri]SER11645.1 hypothetical protein SAMN05216548_111118 [Faunimonas pinastri]